MEERSFKELLEYYIRESGYTNYDFAKETGINRVNIQRYLAGTRVPNQQTFDTIKNNLRLNAVEVKLFTEQYRLAFYGEDFYFQRKEVKEILEKAADICTVEPRLPQTSENRQTEIIETVRGSVAVERFIWSKISGELQKKADTFAYFYIPAENYVLGRLVPDFEIDGKPAFERLSIIQLIQLSKRADISSSHYHNLRVLNNLIPFYFQAGAGYETYYYYHNHPAMELNDGLLYPYYVICETCVILLSVDMEQAVCVTDQTFSDQYRERFLKKIERAEKLVTYFENPVNLLASLLREDAISEKRLFLEYQPCFAAWADGGMINSILREDLPGREQIAEAMEQRVKHLQSTGEFYHYFTQEGMEQFVKTGLCEDYPEEYVRPLSRKERAEMLGRICRSIEEEKREIGLINRQDLNLSKSLGVFVSGGAGLNLILYDEKTGFRHLLIREESLIQSFEAYIKSMKENGEVYPKEKSLEILHQYQADLARF